MQQHIYGNKSVFKPKVLFKKVASWALFLLFMAQSTFAGDNQRTLPDVVPTPLAQANTRFTSFDPSTSPPLKRSAEDEAILNLIRQRSKGPYACATYDASFKHVMEDDEVLSAFLRTFAPDRFKSGIHHIDRRHTGAIPRLTEAGHKQTFMDLHVTANDDHAYIIEMQVRRHVMFDERALFYWAHTFSSQVTSEQFKNPTWYFNLKPVIAIQVVDYDTSRAKGITNKPDHVEDTLVARANANPLPEGQFLKEYEVRCKQSGQTIEHFSMVQIELPRAEKQQKLFPPQKDFSETMWFLSVLRHADKYTKEMVEQLEAQQAVPDFIKRMLHRLTFDVWQPTLLREYKEGVGDRVVFATEYAVEREEGRKEGRLEERQKLLTFIKSGNLNLSESDMLALQEQLTSVSLEGSSPVQNTTTHKKPASTDTGHA